MLEKPPGENSSKENEEDKPYIYDIRETAYDARYGLANVEAEDVSWFWKFSGLPL